MRITNSQAKRYAKCASSLTLQEACLDLVDERATIKRLRWSLEKCVTMGRTDFASPKQLTKRLQEINNIVAVAQEATK